MLTATNSRYQFQITIIAKYSKHVEKIRRKIKKNLLNIKRHALNYTLKRIQNVCWWSTALMADLFSRYDAFSSMDLYNIKIK